MNLDLAQPSTQTVGKPKMGHSNVSLYLNGLNKRLVPEIEGRDCNLAF